MEMEVMRRDCCCVKRWDFFLGLTLGSSSENGEEIVMVLHLLRRYLGEYVDGLSLDALRISNSFSFPGDVILKDLKLEAEALNALKLPVIVKARFVGTITLKVPWKSLGKELVIVLIDRIFILAQPATNGHALKEEDRRKLFEAKLHQIECIHDSLNDTISSNMKSLEMTLLIINVILICHLQND
ncbi:hypothetical protein K2173_011504 [Erythroxylum novogranatense]|uniref:Chorein N-terminal domain-containing protein n=1 Tax=Erythroxylum novogranatense TaxID=1862640 RepID=A0AAV8TVS5_9ROSI|nr:hypothetical protein K2173_011504 [Erythroxylum novogranatense]